MLARNKNPLFELTIREILITARLIRKHDKYIKMMIDAEKFGKEFQQFVDTTNDSNKGVRDE